MPTSRDIRARNRRLLLQHIVAQPAVSRPALAAATGLSHATVGTLAAELLDLGLVAESGYEESAGGRPRALLTAAGADGRLIGVDVAETYVHAELFDLSLAVRASAAAPLHPGDLTPDTVVDRIAAAVDAALARGGAEPGSVLGAGVSMPGQVDRPGSDHATIGYAANWAWQDVPLTARLAARLPYPVHLDNPLRACTAAELWFGAARGRNDAVVLNLGTGVGAGLAVGGEVYRGSTNSAGEWGHTTLVLDGRRCHCGARGCVEAYIGAAGIMRTLRERAPRSLLLSPSDQTATIAALGRAAAAGDKAANDVLAETARYLGAATADLVNLLNPEVVVLSSWVAAALGEPLLHKLRPEVRARALPRPGAAVELALSPVPSNPVSLGAAAFALEGALAPAAPKSRRGTRS
ncbi:ROK family transcriptional regulator [Streptomyces coryli]|nr:ROK family protein [Streptomyces coryli]